MISYFPYYADNYILYDELFSYDGTSFYSAKNQNFDIEYILKVFPKSQNGMKDRFINEISMLKKLDHPNIAHIYYHFEDMSFFFIVFEKWKCLLKEEVEKNYMKRGTIQNSFQKILPNNTISEILNGVQYCHQNGVVHFNLNFWTIAIDHHDHIKLIGFDYAFYDKRFSQNMQSSPLIEFVPPEVLMMLSKKISFPADIWSLGVLFYYIKVEKSPWQNTADEKQKIILIKSGKVSLTPKNDFSLTFILHQMLVVNPDMRKPIDQVIHFFEKNKFNSQTSINLNFELQDDIDDNSISKRSSIKGKKALASRMYRMSCPYGMIQTLKQ